MATNAPEEEIVFVRGSAEHREYMHHQAGWLRALVNGFENYLSIAGRSLLLIFILYATIKGGMLAAGDNTPGWLDIVMLGFQVAGLEGSIPGLTRLRETMLQFNRHDEAKSIKRAIYSSRTLNFLTGLEILLASHQKIGPWQTAE